MIPSLGFDQPGYLWLIPLGIAILVAILVTSPRGLSRWQAIRAGVLRGLLLIVLALALAGLTLQIPANALGVVFVVDSSASVGTEGHQRAMDFINEALSHQGPKDAAGIVVFGGDSMVEVAPREGLTRASMEARPSPHHSNIASGIRLARAILPSDRARRIVVLSDGEQTKEDARDEVLIAAGDDLKISTVTLPRETGPEVFVDSVLTPAYVDEGAPFEVRVIAETNVATSGTLRLYRNGQYLGDRAVQLRPGEKNVFPITQRADGTGVYQYRATLDIPDASKDTVPQNNEAMASVQVTGRPRLLLVDSDPRGAKHLAAALRNKKLSVDVITPTDYPPGLNGLRNWSAIMFSDVAAYEFTNRQMEATEAFVQDLGRGFAMVGGENSFGVGGYYETPIERALPVNMDLEDKTRFPKLAMVFAIDKSGSMGGFAGSKIDMAKEAAVISIELLNERDQLGVIGFDHAASWVVPLQDLSDKQGAINMVGTLRSGGGTDIYPALDAAYQALDGSDAALKHVVLLSDGITGSGAFKTLIEGARARKITTTSLAFGGDADRRTMEDLANYGGGQYYLVTDAKAIPAIFTRETLLASRSFLIEEPFRATAAQNSPVLQGLTADEIPTLLGFVATEPKRRTVTALSVPPTESGGQSLPLLAHGQYGLGRSLAFTSDAKMRWSKQWIGKPSFTQLWTQVGRWLVADVAGADLDATATIQDGILIVTVDAYDEDGSFRNFLEGEARVVAPDMTTRAVALRQVGPGRYEARTEVDQDGAWLTGVALTKNGRLIGKTVTEAVQPWSPEYRTGGGGTALMTELGRLGGGGELSDPASVVARPDTPRDVPYPLWPPLIGLAGLLLLADVAMRRLRLGKETDLPTTYLTASTADVPIRSYRKPTQRRAAKRPQKPPTTDAPTAPVAPQPPPTPGTPAPVQDAGSYANRLLAARKRARTQKTDEEID